MIYCRWSSDYGECDVYVYEDCSGGWTTHVAGRRLKHRVPDEIRQMYAAIDWSAQDAGDRFMEAYKAHVEWGEPLISDDSQYIDLSAISRHAGKSFNDATPGECAARLIELRASGLNVPQYAIDALLQEAKEEEA